MKPTQQQLEKELKKFWGDTLSAEEYPLAFEIYQKIRYPPDDLPFEQWREKVAQLETAYANQLSQATTPPEKSALRLANLWLKYIAAETARNYFQNPEQALAYYQQGIELAQDFIQLAETSPGVRQTVLNLCLNAGVDYGNASPPNIEQELAHYALGLAYAKAFLATGELTAGGQRTVLSLCYNAGVTYYNASPPNIEQALAHWQQGLAYAKAFLATGELTADGQETVLSLCVNAGIAYGNASPPNIEQELAHYAQGLAYAKAFLATGELTAKGQDAVLRLYENRSTLWANNGLINQALVDLPLHNYLLWELASQFTPGDWQTPLGNQKLQLSHFISPQHFVTHSQHFFTQLLAQPDLFRHLRARVIGQRLLSPTEMLLRLAEGFYMLDELQMRQGLSQAYQKLGLALDWRLAEQWQAKIGEPLALCLAQIKPQWCQLVKQEALPVDRTGILDLFACQQKLANRPWYQKLFSRRRWQSLEADLANYQQLWQQGIELKMAYRWDQNRTQAKTAQVEWLKSVLLKFLPLPAGLTDPAAIVLAAVTADLPIDAESQTYPQWQNPAAINEALQRSHLLGWAITHQESLWDWPSHFKSIKLTESAQQQDYSKLRDALLAWQQGDYSIIFIYLQSAWITAQEQAMPLARLLTALQDQNLSKTLDVVLDKGATEPSTRQSALTAIIQGKGQEALTHAIESWLARQGMADNINPFPAITQLQERFERLLQIFPRTPPHSNWQEKVNELAAQLLTETLTPDSPDLVQLWEILERARIAFVTLTQRTNLEAWFLNTGEELAQAFDDVLSTINHFFSQGQFIPDHAWPPLATWLTRLADLIPTPPSITECQTHLANDEALVQPFFDHVQQCLRVLWLDNKGLQLHDLPTACAQEADWKGDNSVIAQWQQFAMHYKNGNTKGYENWEQLMQQPAITTFANQLATWAQATQRKQLTVIFPAPLGQIAWESLPSLENLLSREISLAHWLKTKTTSPAKPTPKRWLYSDPSGLKECMVKEIQWLTKYLGSKPTPQITRLQALQQLATCDHVHLATHGKFVPEQPLTSYLTLDQQRDFPLWFATALRLPTDLIVLSACESNLNGLDTEGLLTPIGIGPALAAAGANTVVGTLWTIDGTASFFFTYHFYQIMAESPDLPWHQIVTRARQRLKTMSVDEAKTLINDLTWDNDNQACQRQIQGLLLYAQTNQIPPFEDFWYWAGFYALGSSPKRSFASQTMD